MMNNFLENGLTTENLMTFLGCIIFLYVVFWVLVSFWVWKDISERTENGVLKVICVLLPIVLTPPGVIVYILIRPRDTLDEIYWSELEKRYLLYETFDLADCGKCGFSLQPGFVKCPKCGSDVKYKCEGCGKYLASNWQHCPYCGVKSSRVQPEPLEVKQEKVEDTEKVGFMESVREVIGNTKEKITTLFAKASKVKVSLAKSPEPEKESNQKKKDKKHHKKWKKKNKKRK